MAQSKEEASGSGVALTELLYATGEEPTKGDYIKSTLEPNGYVWIVIGICNDMVRAKREDAPAEKEAFFTKYMRKLERI